MTCNTNREYKKYIEGFIFIRKTPRPRRPKHRWKDNTNRDFAE